MKKATIPAVLGCMLAILASAWAQDADEPIFSGPQVGEKLVSFKAQGVLGDLAGKEFDLVEQSKGGPVAIIFLHALTRPSAAVTRAAMTYGAKFADEGLTCGVVFLADDATATAAQIKRASHALPKVPIGISVDGGEGPGAYGLNRKMTLTILVGKDNKVTANFPLIQPSLQADAPKIGRAIASVVGKDVTPTLAQMGVKGQYTGNTRPANQRDPKLDPLLRAVIQKTATKEQVEKAVAAVEEYVSKNAAAKRQVGEIANRIVESGKLSNYGTPTAQEYLRKWAKEYFVKKKPPTRPRTESSNDDPPSPSRQAYIMVTEGIVGGFVAAHIRQRTLVVKSSKGFDVLVLKQPIRGDPAVYQRGSLSNMQFAGLLKDLGEKGLWKLPVESPAGCDDIFQMDTSIAVRAGKEFWRNGGPAGCVRGESKVQPSDEQRKQFGELVVHLKQLAEKIATDDDDGKQLNEALKVINSDKVKSEKRGTAKNAATKF